MYSNLSCLPKDLTCLLSKPHAKNNAAQIVTPLCVYMHQLSRQAFYVFTLQWPTVSQIRWVGSCVWPYSFGKTCVCESLHCRDLFILEMPNTWECESSRQSDGSYTVCAMILPKHINQSEWVMLIFSPNKLSSAAMFSSAEETRE